jgi:hypothetical protein
MQFNKNVDTKTDSFGSDKVSAVWESGVYQAKLKYVADDVTKKGKPVVNVSVEINGLEKVFSFYPINSKTGDQFYYDKDNNKKVMPGFQMLNSLFYVVTGKKLDEADFKQEKKAIKVHNFAEKKDEIKELMVYTELSDQPISVAVKQIEKHKTIEQEEGKYVPTTETYMTNEIDKFLSAKGFTARELHDGSDAEYALNFKEKHTGEVFNEKLKVIPVSVNGAAAESKAANVKSLFD